MSNTFKDKVVWITGASSGIGEALALALASEGSKLILSSRRQKELEIIKDKCLNIRNIYITILILDLADSETLKAKVKEAESIYGHIDILINNGGVSQRETIINTNISVQRRIMEINYFGAIALSQYVLPKMIERKSGHHVVISSATGIISTPLRAGYAASKHALHGWYDSLRAECHDDNIKVTLICPGYVRTNISYNALTGYGEKYNQMDDAQDKGMTAKKVAEIILKSIKKEKQEVYIGGFLEKMAIYIKRFFPLFFSIVIRKIKVT